MVTLEGMIRTSHGRTQRSLCISFTVGLELVSEPDPRNGSETRLEPGGVRTRMRVVSYTLSMYFLPVAVSSVQLDHAAHFDLITHEMLHLQYTGFHAGDDIITVRSHIFTKSLRKNAQQ